MAETHTCPGADLVGFVHYELDIARKALVTAAAQLEHVTQVVADRMSELHHTHSCLLGDIEVYRRALGPDWKDPRYVKEQNDG